MMEGRKENLLRLFKHAGVLALNAIEKDTHKWLTYKGSKEKTSWQSAGLNLHA